MGIGGSPNCKLLLQHFLLHPQTALAASSSLFCDSVTWRHLWCHLRHLLGAVPTANCFYNTFCFIPKLLWLLAAAYSAILQLGNPNNNKKNNSNHLLTGCWKP